MTTRRLVQIGGCLGLLSILLAGCAALQPAASQRILSANEAAVVRWLDDWEKAWNLHDVRKLQVMSNLDTAEMLTLQRTFEDRANLDVSIGNIRVREFEGGIVQATYTRRERWTDATTGKVGSTSAAYEHSFRVGGGVAQPYALKRR